MITPKSIMAECPKIYGDGPRCGFHCPPGWLKLVRELSLKLEALADDDVHVEQVKEKFGTLRFYTSCGIDTTAYELIEEAEALSAKTCQRCGSPGELRGGGWLVTLCDGCNT